MKPPRPRELNFPVLAHAGLHETKIAVLCYIAGEGNAPATPKDLGVALKLPLGQVSYHIRQLVEKGLLVLDHTAPVRGALQHWYVVAPHVMLSGRQEAHARLVAGANAKVQDPGQMLFAILDKVGAVSGEWSDMPDDWQKRLRKAGREVFGVA